MNYVPVQSTLLSAVAFDVSTNTLGARLVKGHEYHYFGVSETIYRAVLDAGSHGTAFRTLVIAGGYPYLRVA